MPTAYMLTLRPTAAASVPANLGRGAHAAILRMIAMADGELATWLHEPNSIKPLTVSNILGMEARNGMARITPAHTYGLRVTLLNGRLEHLARDWSAGTLGVLEIGQVGWRVERVTCDPAEHPRANCCSYEALATTALRAAGHAPRQWTLEFTAPVTFRHGSVNEPLPLPTLVFGSLFDKWNAFAPLPLPAELRETIDALAVSRFDLHSVALPTKGGALQIGAVGRCSYAALGTGLAWLAGVDLLARFAFYSGVGAGTARGFGQTQLVEPNTRTPSRPETINAQASDEL